MWPAILGMTYALLPESKAGLAGGLIIGVAGLGNAIGPLIGGFLTDELSWEWVFFLNVPVAAFAIFVTARVVPETKADTTERHIDYLGIVMLSLGIVAILVALDEGTDAGFGDPVIVGLFVLGAVLLGSFLAVERRQGDGALVPRDVLRNRVFAVSCVVVLLMSALFFAVLLYLPQFMEKVLGFSPLGSGAGLLPLMGVFAAASFVAGWLYGRLGGRVVVASGAACLGLGMLLLSFLDDDASVCIARSGDGRARARGRPLLLVDHHHRRHRARPVAVEPRRRHRLHVPDRRRRGGTRAQHRDRVHRFEPLRRHRPRVQGRRRARAGGPGRGARVHRPRRAPRPGTGDAPAGPPSPPPRARLMS